MRISDWSSDVCSSDLVSIEAVIRRFPDILFPGYEVEAHGAFRVIRDSDIELEEEAEDLVRYFRSAIKRRRKGRVIWLEMLAEMPESLERLVKDEVGGRERSEEQRVGKEGCGQG